MPVNFSYADGRTIPSRAGFPAGYSGYRIEGVTAYSCTADFGEIVIQEILTLFCTIRHQFIQWARPGRIYCHYTDPGIHMRTVVSNNLFEKVKGEGAIDIVEGEMVALLSNSWHGLIYPAKKNSLVCIDTIWSPEFFQRFTISDALTGTLAHTHQGIADLHSMPRRRISPQMRMILRNIFNLPLKEPFRYNRIDEQMHDLYGQMVAPIQQVERSMLRLDPHEEAAVLAAKEFIESDVYRPFTLKEISRRVALGATSLKAAFHKMTGYGLQEYQVYLRLLDIRNQILTTDLPLKAFYEKAGYKSLAAFIVGFKTYLNCTPGDLRRNGWHLSADRP